MKKFLKSAIQKSLAQQGYEIRKREKPRQIGPITTVYQEREEYGPSNLETKLQNVKEGLPFEYPDIINLNHAVEKLLGDETRIVELGSGTGTFAIKAAENPKRHIFASEFDTATCDWCLKERGRPNITYHNGPVPPDAGPFDILVTIEVVEHVSDYFGFLKECARLAPRALISTPNRARGPEYFHAGPPPYIKHIREWTVGEFYWVLRCLWADVKIYGLTSQSEPTFTLVDVDSRLSPLIADCRNPIANR